MARTGIATRVAVHGVLASRPASGLGRNAVGVSRGLITSSVSSRCSTRMSTRLHTLSPSSSMAMISRGMASVSRTSPLVVFSPPSASVAAGVSKNPRVLLRSWAGAYHGPVVPRPPIVTMPATLMTSAHALRQTAIEVAPSAFASTTQQRIVAAWVAGGCALVFGMVVLGGVTRLTESGLSMVNWRFLGRMPPSTEEEWQAEFDEYKQYPEWDKLNRNMTLDEFKRIFWYEYAHRMLGRAIGAYWLLPMGGFWAAGWFEHSRFMKRRSALILSMIVGQGLIGWYMVKSGLEEERFAGNNSRPTVSPYRLALHLGSAFVIYVTMLATYMNVAPSRDTLFRAMAPVSKRLRFLRGASHGLMGLVYLTAISGAFVAGLDAGLVYNEFPWMGEGLVPEDLIDPNLTPAWRNLFENHTTAQFDHRYLGITTYTAITALFLYARRHFGALPPVMRASLWSMLLMANVQVGLGIWTLLEYVPVHLGAMHQAGSLTLLSVAVWLANNAKRMPLAK